MVAEKATNFIAEKLDVDEGELEALWKLYVDRPSASSWPFLLLEYAKAKALVDIKAEIRSGLAR